MAGIKNSFPAFLAAICLASGVVAQTSTLEVDTCGATDNANGVTDGNSLTTFELLCGTRDGDGVGTDTVNILTGDSFSTLCTLAGSGPFTTVDGRTIDLAAVLTASDGVVPHTIFAPTDSAFDKVPELVNLVNELIAGTPTTAEQQRYDNIVANWLQLHVLGDYFLSSDFTCDDTINTVNLATTVIGNQKQKTKCRGQANTFAQIGGGNVGTIDQPTVGSPAGIFDADSFIDDPASLTSVTTTDGGISSDIVGCNGVIHVVDNVLLPGYTSYYGPYYGYYGSKGTKGYNYNYYGKSKGKVGKGDKTAKYASFYGERLLSEAKAENNREADRENRKARLETLLIDANGNTEALN